MLLLSVESSLPSTRTSALTSTALMAISPLITVLPFNLLPSSGVPVRLLSTPCTSTICTPRLPLLWPTGVISSSLLFPKLLSMHTTRLKLTLPAEKSPFSLTSSRLQIFSLTTTHGLVLTTLTPLSFSLRSPTPNLMLGLETRLNSSTTWLLNTN